MSKKWWIQMALVLLHITFIDITNLARSANLTNFYLIPPSFTTSYMVTSLSDSHNVKNILFWVSFTTIWRRHFPLYIIKIYFYFTLSPEINHNQLLDKWVICLELLITTVVLTSITYQKRILNENYSLAVWWAISFADP